MGLTAQEARRWLERFEAIAEADREALRREGPRTAWSFRLALSLIEAARRSSGRLPVDPGRAEEDAAVRQIWERLRQRLRR